jgi:hypothetical protein
MNIKMLERQFEKIPSMTEAETEDQLRAVKAMRDSFGATLSFLGSVSLPVSEDREDPISKLRSQLSSELPFGDENLRLLNYIEYAFKRRLEELRGKGH